MRLSVKTLLLLVLSGVVAAAAWGAVSSSKHRKHRVRHTARAIEAPSKRAGPLGPPLFGFNDNSVLMSQSDSETALIRSAKAGANVVRYTVNWDYVEPRQGQWNWRGYDPLYQSALRHHIRPILIAAFSPGWTRQLDLSCGAQAADHCHNPPDPKYDGAWVNFITELVRRYPKAEAIEVWNEPNLANFWHKGPNAARYAQLLNLAYQAVKRQSPSMKVLGGVLANSEFGGNGSTPYEPYLNDLLDRNPSFDALSIHDYDSAGTSDDWFGKTLSIARSALDSHGRADVPIWVTEIGRSTAGDNPVTPDEQALRLVEMLTTLGEHKDVAAALVHTLLPARTEPMTEEYGYSTLNADGSVKPAYCALAKVRLEPRPRGCPR
jgi:polysaccharide biosynthesis protein PslG